MTVATRVRVEIERDPNRADIEFLDAQLDATLVAESGHDDAHPLVAFARDDAGALIGGLHGVAWGSCCELLTLWVREDGRNQGLAARLLAAIEAEARRVDCVQVVLFTHARRVPSLYTEAGYTVAGSVADYPAGLNAYWLRKVL